jgi:hypothetical protein
MRDGDKMTHDDILRFLRMARGSAATWNGPGVWCEFDQLENFWKIAAIAEREECAKVCDEMERKAEGPDCCKWPTPVDCAFLIRARGKE